MTDLAIIGTVAVVFIVSLTLGYSLGRSSGKVAAIEALEGIDFSGDDDE